MVKFGLFAINYGTCAEPETAVRVAQHAEAAGFESVWTGEHLVLPDPRPEGFSMAPDLGFLDTIVALTLVAAETSTIRVASGIIELPLHHPVQLAKQLASIDQQSKGRLIVGVGAGYLEPEFAAMGVALDERGSRMDEHLDAMTALWTADHPQFRGQHVAFSGINAFPRPFQPNGPPIVFGGIKAPVRRRMIAKGDGWYLFQTDLDLAAEAIDVINREQAELGRPAGKGPLEITMTPVGSFDRSVVERYEALGVDRLVLLPWPEAPSGQRHDPVPVDDILRTIDRVGDEFINR